MREVSVRIKHKLIGIDLAENVFQVCAINQSGKDVFNHSVSRAKLAAKIALFEPYGRLS